MTFAKKRRFQSTGRLVDLNQFHLFLNYHNEMVFNKKEIK
jgi:hypothetical protein